MSSAEHHPQDPFFTPEGGISEDVLQALPPEIDEGLLPAPTAQEMEVLHRRDLVFQATSALEEVLDVRVSVPALLVLAQDKEPTQVRLQAKRALRCLTHIGTKDSPVVHAVGVAGIYHYVEGVMDFGASKDTYMGLMETFRLSAEEATSLYALRELVADETNGQRVGFPTLCKVLESVGMSVQQAAQDPETALVAFHDAGLFVGYMRGVVFDRPVFMPGMQNRRPLLRRNADSVRSTESLSWLRARLEDPTSRYIIDEDEA
jgi:hypothetical protein